MTKWCHDVSSFNNGFTFPIIHVVGKDDCELMEFEPLKLNQQSMAPGCLSSGLNPPFQATDIVGWPSFELDMDSVSISGINIPMTLSVLIGWIREMGLKRLPVTVLISAFAIGLCYGEAKPLKVFVLAGQSNMQGHAQIRTLSHIGMDPQTAPILEAITTEGGEPILSEEVWISYLSSEGVRQGRLTAGFGASHEKIGPEWTFGVYLQKMLNEPILLIKTAWGGKSINTDFRSPSAGPFEFTESQLENLRKQKKDLEAILQDKKEATGYYYREMIRHVNEVLSDVSTVYPQYDPDLGYELAGFVWFQGWNDMVDRGVYPNRDKAGGYHAYSEVMAHFIRDVRTDLKAPAMPFVIGVLGVGGPVDKYGPSQKRYAGIHQNFRDAMAAPAALAEFKGNVAAVLTENYWDLELVSLRAKESAVRQKVRKIQKEKKLDRAAAKKVEEQLMKESFSDLEWKTLKTGVSNQEYHYLGSGKIMAQIGKGFAEALYPMLP